MKKFKKLWALSLVAVLTVGCGSTSSEEASTETDVDVLDATISVQSESGWLPYYEAAVERVVAKHPEATINIIETGSFDNLDIIDSTDVTNPDVADVFIIPIDRVYGLSQNEALASIDAQALAAEIGGYDNYDAGLGGKFQLDGDYLAFPMNIETLVVFANEANAAASGIDLTQPVEFSEIGGEDMLSVVHDAWFGVAFTNSADLTLLGNEDGVLYSDLEQDFSELTADQQALFTSLFEYWQAHDQLGTNLWDKEAAWGYIDSAFTSGNQTALRIDGPWSTASMSERTNGGEDMAVLPLDTITLNGNPLTHWQGGWGLAVNARVEGQEAEMALAEELIKELVNPDYAVDFFITTGKILPNVDALVYAEAEGLTDIDKTVITRVIESFEGAVERPLFTEWGQVWVTWQNGLLSWSSVKPATVEEAYEQVQASFEAMMSNF